MATDLLGREVSASLRDKITQKTASLKERGITPTLCLVRVGEKEDDLSYERGIKRCCEGLGIGVETIVFPQSATQEELLACIEGLNRNERVHGVLLFRPLPPHLNEDTIANALLPDKDVDGMGDLSLAGAFTGKRVGFAPCTAQACMEILDYYGIDPEGKRCTIMGRSLVVGRPLAMMLMQRNATITITHTRTRDVEATCQAAEILLVAIGREKAVGLDHVSPGQVVIDVGIHVGEDGRLCGDVDYEAVAPLVLAITPVPGGVGAVTTTVLASHVVEAALRQVGEE